MDNKKLILLVVGLFFIAAVLVSKGGDNNDQNLSGLATGFSTSTDITVGTGTGSNIAIATSSCNSRLIRTSGQAILLTFSDKDGDVPTATTGHGYQSASTSVSYDASEYGCGAVKIYSEGTQTVTVTDFR